SSPTGPKFGVQPSSSDDAPSSATWTRFISPGSKSPKTGVGDGGGVRGLPRSGVKRRGVNGWGRGYTRTGHGTGHRKPCNRRTPVPAGPRRPRGRTGGRHSRGTRGRGRRGLTYVR